MTFLVLFLTTNLTNKTNYFGISNGRDTINRVSSNGLNENKFIVSTLVHFSFLLALSLIIKIFHSIGCRGFV
jgi:hypothetical protein